MPKELYPTYKKQANGKDMPEAYLAEEGMEQLLQGASREAVRRLRWQMEHGPTLMAKERAAQTLAKLCVPKPPMRIEQSGPGGTAIHTKHEIVFPEWPPKP